jgi:hypothetical protein
LVTYIPGFYPREGEREREKKREEDPVCNRPQESTSDNTDSKVFRNIRVFFLP